MAANPIGYAYIDKYGFSHVVHDRRTAQEAAANPNSEKEKFIDVMGNVHEVYSEVGNGPVYEYTGSYGGGYALNSEEGRVNLPLPGVVAFGNSQEQPDTPIEKNQEFAKFIGQTLTGPWSTVDYLAVFSRDREKDKDEKDQ